MFPPIPLIAIVSSAARERAALASLCEHRGWNPFECPSVRAFIKIIQRVSPKVMLVRYQLQDGCSEDAIRALSEQQRVPAPKIIVLLSAGASSVLESRQLMLGADCVQRDPVRSDVLVAYVEKYLQAAQSALPSHSVGLIRFSAATLHPLTRILQHQDRSVVLTPREAMLLELLVSSGPDVVSYETLYSEILGRRFRGETSNMRVLLAKLNTSARAVGIALRNVVEVIPKSGYRYSGPDQASA